jgi:hypothetical protein
MRLRVVSARAERWSRIAGGFAIDINPSSRIKGYNARDAAVKSRRSFSEGGPIRRPVTIAEPTTLITDYLLGTVAEICAVLLLKQNARLRQSSIRYWALALCAVAAASYVGGTYHGFQHVLEPPVARVLWKTTTISMGVASFLLLAAAFAASVSADNRRWLIGAAALKLIIYIMWMLEHDEFRFVIYDYGSTLAILLLLVIAGKTHGVGGHRGYIASGILVSIAAAGVQQSGVRLHQHFNHNDLMHVVQMGGVWLLYKGGARLRDAGEVHDPQP